MGIVGNPQVWEIGKTRFGGDWRKRMKLFDCLVGSVIGFEAKLLERKDREAPGQIYKRSGGSGREEAEEAEYVVGEEGKRKKLRS